MNPLCLTALALVVATPAFALQECKPGKEDSRVRYCSYSPNQVYHIWTAPGGILQIVFSENESVPEGNVAATDGSRLDRKPRGNILYLKSTAKEGQTPCMMPEPLLVTTKLPDGRLRPYQFEIQTKPDDCDETPAAQIQQHPLTLAATGAIPKPPPHVGNLRYVKQGGLDAGADVFYSAVFTYPGDETAKRRAAAQARDAEAQKHQVKSLLKQQMTLPYGNQFDGSWNLKYAGHGSPNLTPAEIRDNGWQTVLSFPQMDRVPALFRWQPGANGCNRAHDDRNEATVNPSVHKSGAQGDTIIAEGTAQGWCLRDGSTVYEIRNLGYTLAGATPATGTASPQVERVIKGEQPDDR